MCHLKILFTFVDLQDLTLSVSRLSCSLYLLKWDYHYLVVQAPETAITIFFISVFGQFYAIGQILLLYMAKY